MSYELFIATRYLKSKRRTGFISLISYLSIAGVAIGVAALIIVLSVMNGFETEVRNRIIGADAHIRLGTHHEEGIVDVESIMDKIRDIDHITGISPYIMDKGLIRIDKRTEGAIVRGVDPATVGDVSDLPQTIIHGGMHLGRTDVTGAENLPGLVLGRMLADRLYATLGDTVILFSPGAAGPFSQPRAKRFHLAGIFETGLYEYDDIFAYIAIPEAQELYRMTDKVTGIEIKLDDLDKAGQVKEIILGILGFPYFPRTWHEMHRNLFNWMKIEKWAGFIILSLIVMVAAFNIISSLIMVVMEKRKEIGILKSMGATSASIRKIFIYEGLAVGVVGTVMGVMLGWGLCMLQISYRFFRLPPDIYFLSELPILMRSSDFIMVITAALVLCFLASVYPAHRAAALVPVEAIRYE
ncbi:lipoprotein-releasing system transmembrane subunit LolC [candidate division LCP-89 bacterium B3_LCP]|uniref:Lipoprotein-releasing system transmembrane subunit LolC n=1 Tax=candidate division LCP-89 bacterium B3_LCP TaxID=2012998 RepID=A0A532URJ6_UNCL8|nr:MAG: lipoprotein-releasing system transmembrane subunit LolC [candidate division LCP-89 bacterium B3_LCP]